MVKGVRIEKSGEAKEIAYEAEMSDLYRRCNFRKDAGFEEACTWQVKSKGSLYTLKVYGRSEGKHNAVNTFEFPPPIDKHLFYGACAVIAVEDDDPVDLEVDQWKHLYKKLYGGFEDLSKTECEDDAEEDELDDVPGHLKTTTGYLKDGFVVESGESSEEDHASDQEKMLSSHTETEECASENSESSEDATTDDEGSELSHEDYLTDE